MTARRTLEGKERLKAAAGAGALHFLLGYALVTGLGYDPVREAAKALEVISVPLDPPPPVEKAAPAEAETKAAQGAASPPDLKARPTPVVAPPPKVRLPVPPPLPTADETAKVPPGSDSSAGSAEVPGPGSGSGGLGTGPGSGGQGSGSGGGAARAQRVSGRLANEDYPRSALRAGAEGDVRVRYTVGADGRARDCTVVRSSGHEDLDSTTCRLIEQRFRYRPARDASGRPVPEPVSRTFSWLLPFRR